MSQSLADLTSRPLPLAVALKDEGGMPTGEILECLVHPLDFRDIGTLQRWIDAQFPDPFDNAWEAIRRHREQGREFNVAQEKLLLQQASELALRPRNLIGTSEADRLLLSTEGTRQIILAGIRKGDPSFDDAKAAALMRSMTEMDIVRAYSATQMGLVASDPKGTPPAATKRSSSTGSSGSRRTRRAEKARRRGGQSSTSS